MFKATKQNIIFSDYYNKYIKWNWIDVSKDLYIKDAKHHNIEINQLYRPWVELWLEKYDFLYSFNVVNQNKFSIICLKEWLYLVKIWWFLIIHFEENNLLNHEKFLSDLLQAWPNWEFVLEENDRLNNFYVIKKVKSLLIEWDSIEKWTFWIVTQGKRDDWLNQIIDSIENQNIPNYEIILCGKVNNDEIINRKNVVYVEFTQNDEKWWITKKKNLIVEKAKYENLCIIHDRIIFEKWWYEWMKKWWNNFEHLTIHLKYWKESGHLFYMDQIFWSLIPYQDLFISYCNLHYEDWDINTVAWGTIHILKRSITSKHWFDEKLFWIDFTFEDAAITYLQSSHWYILRANPYSVCDSLYFRFWANPYRKLNKNKMWWYENIKNYTYFYRKINSFFWNYEWFKKLRKVRDSKDSLFITFKKFINELRK